MVNINGNEVGLIGEIKIRSPSGFRSHYSWDHLFDMANKHPHVKQIALHIEFPWLGSLEVLRYGRSRTDKHIMVKTYKPTDEIVRKAFNIGADSLLAVGRIPDIYLGDFICWEPENLDQLRNMHQQPGYYRIKRIAWNSRDFSKGLGVEGRKSETIEDARKLWPGALVQASNIRRLEDVSPVADQILVGSYLPEFLKLLE